MSDLAPPEDFEDLFDNAPCGYLILRSDGYILKANATLALWLGLAPEALAERRLRDLLTVPGRILYETNLAPLLRIQAAFEEVMLDIVTASGTSVPVLASAAARPGSDGQAPTIRMVLVRTPDRRSYERNLQARDLSSQQVLSDEREAARLREEFIAVLGHDLRNPLASIIGAARLLRREAQSEKALRVIQLMETSVDRMAGLIDNVMDFARGRLGGGIGLVQRPTPLEPVLRHVVAELEAAHPSRTILVEIDAAEPIELDGGRIGQLVSNLLGNALTHGDPRAPVRLYAQASEGRLELSVANAGAPIPEAALPRLFQPFFRSEVQQNAQGLGLGLHIASEIAKAHDGALDVTSNADETRFTFRMPLA